MQISSSNSVVTYTHVYTSGPEEFVNSQRLLVQSSKWFGISSVQCSSPLQFGWKVRSVQFGARWPWCLRSVQFTQFISQTFPQGCGAGAEPGPTEPAHFGRSCSLSLGTFCSEPEPEPSKKVSAQAFMPVFLAASGDVQTYFWIRRGEEHLRFCLPLS